MHWHLVYSPVDDIGCQYTGLPELCAMVNSWAPDPGDGCGIGAVYDNNMDCTVVCDAGCFQGIADKIARTNYETACAADGWIIAIDLTCVKPWAPGDRCGTNGFRSSQNVNNCIELPADNPCATGAMDC